MNEIVARPADELTHDIGSTTETYWLPPANMDFEHFQAIGNTFQQIKQSLAFWLGDWLLAGEERFGEDAYQAVSETGRSSETILKYRAVCARVPKEIRRADLPWVHHFYVTYILAEHRGPMLDLAANVGLSSRELKEVAKLQDGTRQGLLEAYENYCEEEGPMEHDTFMRLLNRYKHGEIDKPEREPVEKDEDDDEKESDDKSDIEDGDDDLDGIMDFWENQGVPLKVCGRNQATWEGISVYASVNEQGRAVLIWKEIS